MENKILIVLFLLIVLVGCTPKAESIQNEIDAANYCTVKEDCAYVGSQCPFGCYIYVNSAEADRIKGMLDSYESKCAYGCIACSDFDCVDGRCLEICESLFFYRTRACLA